MNIVKLDQAITAVCPIDGVSIGRWNDRASWEIQFRPEATDEQKAAAHAVMDTFDPDAPGNNLKAAKRLTQDDMLDLLKQAGVSQAAIDEKLA